MGHFQIFKLLKLDIAEPGPDEGIFLLDFERLRVVILGERVVLSLLIHLTAVFVRVESHEDVLVDFGIDQVLVF